MHAPNGDGGLPASHELLEPGQFVAPYRFGEDSTSADYYQTICRVLEEGKFHIGFFDDRLAMPDRYGNDHRHTVEHGTRCVKMDPVTVLTVMGIATKRLGPGATRSTTYHEPFDVARTFATLDLMTEGRAAGNVVTSMNDGEALNVGKDEHQEHDSHYDRADEFMKVVLGRWNSWDDDAILHDNRTGIFADPDKVRRLDHQGEWFKSRAVYGASVKQGHPVIIQAGPSGRGKRFSARWGELVFVSTDHGRQTYRNSKAEAERAGREPSHLRITPSAYIACAETKAKAEDKMALIETLATDEDALSLLSEAMNFDFTSKGLDEPFTDAELDGISGTQSMRERALKASGIRNPTARDFVTFSHRARPNNPFTDGPKDVAGTGWRSGSLPGSAMDS